MNEKEIIRKVMEIRGWSQSTLAEKAGFKSQSNITGLLNNNKNGIRTDNLVRMLNALGCEVIVRDAMSKEKTEWEIKL